MKIIQADILSDIDPDKRTVVLHGCNCFHTMGSGIAAYLREQHPSIYDADVESSKYGDKSKLGRYTIARISDNLRILNCYTQYGYGRAQMHADYDAITKCLKRVGKIYVDWEIRSPQIGCGLAGGDWEFVSQIFENELAGLDYTIYYI